jgi:hypothetical protein
VSIPQRLLGCTWKKMFKNAEYASSFFLPSTISFIAKAGPLFFFFPKVDILPEV